MTEPHTHETAKAGSRNTVARGAILVVVLFALILAWPFLSNRLPSSQQQTDAFVAADPELVAIGGSGAPVITSDDVTTRFFSINDMASPAEIRMAVTPLFDSKQPARVWVFAEESWADGTHGADMALLMDDLKARGIDMTLVLPPQQGETADEVIDAFARLSNEKSVTFLDYHDADKLGTALCPAIDSDVAAAAESNAGSARETYNTQQMLLQMAINAPELRDQLRLADIGARIERLKAETVCPGTETTEADEAPATLSDVPATDSEAAE